MATSDAHPTEPFFLIVADHDRGFFSVEGPMTDDGPWKLAAGRAGKQPPRPVWPNRCRSRSARRCLPEHPRTSRRAAGNHRAATRVTDQLPAIIPPSALTTAADAAHLVPALIADAGEAASWRYVEFFTANIRNPHTRRAYARACSRFFAWCEERGLTLTTIWPYDVTTYIEDLHQTHSAPGVKQQLAAARMLFDWLITGQVTPANPASAVRGPRHVVNTGKIPVLEGKDWRKLINAIPTDTVRDLRDRALIATLTYSFARITAP